MLSGAPRVAGMEDKIDKVLLGLAALTRTVDALAQTVDTKLEVVNARLEGIESRVDKAGSSRQSPWRANAATAAAAATAANTNTITSAKTPPKTPSAYVIVGATHLSEDFSAAIANNHHQAIFCHHPI